MQNFINIHDEFFLETSTWHTICEDVKTRKWGNFVMDAHIVRILSRFVACIRCIVPFSHAQSFVAYFSLENKCSSQLTRTYTLSLLACEVGTHNILAVRGVTNPTKSTE